MCNVPCEMCGDNDECEISKIKFLSEDPKDKDIYNFISDFYKWVNKVQCIEAKLDKLIKKTEHDIWNNTDLGTL